MTGDSPDRMEDTNNHSKNMTINNGGCSPELIERHKDRERGIITKADRDFLCRDKEDDETNQQTVRDRRYRIRKRIVNAIKDFDILSHRLGSSDRSQVFQALNNSDRDFLKEAGVFLYLGFLDLGDKASKARFLENVIETAEKRREERDVKARVETQDELSYEIEITDSAVPNRSFLENMIESAARERGVNLTATVKDRTNTSFEITITEYSSDQSAAGAD